MQEFHLEDNSLVRQLGLSLERLEKDLEEENLKKDLEERNFRKRIRNYSLGRFL